MLLTKTLQSEVKIIQGGTKGSKGHQMKEATIYKVIKY